jgi:hypothetical protein
VVAANRRGTAPKCHDHVGGRGCRHIAGTHERQQQIHGDRSSRQRACRGHLGSDIGARAGDRSQPTGLRDRCRELVSGNGTHAGLNNRHVQTAQI